MTMTERLLEATKEIWAGYNEKPFVKGIADGSLAVSYTHLTLPTKRIV